jgi:hypothetical protein
VIELLCVSIAKAAPHPNAVRLFERWFLSRPTQLWVRDELKRISARKDVKNNPLLLDPKVHYVISNPADSANAASVVRPGMTVHGRTSNRRRSTRPPPDSRRTSTTGTRRSTGRRGTS